MARASTRTWLPLDTWSRLMGIHPMHFNGIVSALCPESACDDVWAQWSWQRVNRVSREDLAETISRAEHALANLVGYNLVRDWISPENHVTTRNIPPESTQVAWNAFGEPKSVRTKRGYFLTGGKMALDLLFAAQPIVRTDVDGDGWAERCTVIVDPVTCSLDEVGVFLPGYDGADAYEIRPVNLSLAGTTLTITFSTWQIVDPTLQEGFRTGAVDGDDAGSFVRTVDVYRIYNDPSEQVQLIWGSQSGCGCGSSTCAVCANVTQWGCLRARDTELGIVTYEPGAWNVNTQLFDWADWVVAANPDRVALSYYSGWADLRRGDANLRGHVDPSWARVIANYAAGLIDREVCSCNNSDVYVNSWREDLSRIGSEVQFQLSRSQLGNPLGTTRGAIQAWDFCNAPGRRLP